jgi:hypothetical protein
MPIALIADDFADHAEQIVELLESEAVGARLAVVGAERAYRREYIDIVLADFPRFSGHLKPLTLEESRQLIERYRKFGLVGDSFASGNPEQFARSIHNEPIAIQVCRILNDFRPLEQIVDSLWQASLPNDRLAYLSVALAQYCYSAGVRYSILQATMGPTRPISHLFDRVPLRLAMNAFQDEFVVPISATLAERVLWQAARRNPEELVKAFDGLAASLAPHVNRRAIMRRSPEARLSGRLFDADKVVTPMLNDRAEGFYLAAQPLWEWNSRYWEQRALLKADSDINQALSFARHAVAIEEHPYPLTTLGKLLLRSMESEDAGKSSRFHEAFDVLTKAIEGEARRSRVTVHPFGTIFSGAARHIELGGMLTTEQGHKLRGYLAEARDRFGKDPMVRSAAGRLESCLN